jgi:hypothetical protein
MTIIAIKIITVVTDAAKPIFFLHELFYQL